MSLPLPTSLSPSKVSTFKDCALAFRFSAIDRLPEDPKLATIKGSVVHKALELLFISKQNERTRADAAACLDRALEEYVQTPEFEFLGLHAESEALSAFRSDASTMLDRYYTQEDPTTLEPVGVEIMLSAKVDGLLLRGIIDRLDLNAEGELIVTDYKTGRVPSERQEMSRLGGVHFYAFLCEQNFGKRPAEVRLMYLGANPQTIVATPTEQSIAGLNKKVKAIWAAVERACVADDFRPNPSHACSWCSFKEFCPSFGGDPSLARVDLRAKPDVSAAITTNTAVTVNGQLLA
jgi:putative RecB family exonuclease